MLGKRQVAAPLMALRAAHRAVRPADRRFQPGTGVGVQLGGLWLRGQPERPTQRQFGHETLVHGFAFIAPAASRPGQQRAVRRQRGRQVAPCGHASTVRQRFPPLVVRDEQEDRRAQPWVTSGCRRRGNGGRLRCDAGVAITRRNSQRWPRVCAPFPIARPTW